MRIKSILVLMFYIVVGWGYFWFVTYENKNSQQEEMYIEAEKMVSSKEWSMAINLYLELNEYKDSKEKMNFLYDEMFRKIEFVMENRNYDYYWLEAYISDLKKSEKYRDKILDLEPTIEEGKIQFEEERIEKLSLVKPYVGMNEYDIEYSSWGKPSEINFAWNYWNLTEDRRHKEYKWITKDQYGRVIEIKSFLVKQNKIYTEPKISKYYQ